MTREEYEGKRSILGERMVAADEEIHKQERNCDDDARLGDEKAFRYHETCMKSAEDDFNRSSEEIKRLDNDYWGDLDRSVSSDVTARENQTEQTEKADYWADNSAGNSSANETLHEQEKSLSK